MNYLKFKRGIHLVGVRDEILGALDVCADIFRKRGYDCVVTSTRYSDPQDRHGRGSLHYKGLAVDLRSKHLATDQLKHEVLIEIRQRLGSDYDVLLESLGKPYEHYHIEYDPDHL